MTDRTNRESDICGIATKSWPASEFIAASSDRRARSDGALRFIRLYANFVSYRCTHNRCGAVRRRCLPNDPPCAIDPPAAPARQRRKPGEALGLVHPEGYHD